MGTPESKVKAKLKAYLREHLEAYWFMPVQAGYGSTSLDFLVCSKGEFHAYECKAEGRKLTPRQVLVARQITNAGGYVFKVTLVNGELEFTPCGLTGNEAS
jgi:hypothetical protein